jgi:hypothetical protein
MFPGKVDVNNVKIVKLQHAQSAQWKLALRLACVLIELAKDRMQLRGP